MKKISFEDALILSTIRVLRFFLRRFPIEFWLFLARRVGSVVFWSSRRRWIAQKNLRAAFASDLSPARMRWIAERSMQNLVMSAVELLRFPEMDPSYVRKHVRILGAEKLQSPRTQKKGIIFLTAHFGNWELLNVSAGLLGYPMVVLARVQKHPRSDEFLNELRRSKGAQVIHKGMPVREILKALRKGLAVGILSDQDGGRAGTFVRFFGRWSSSPAGAAAFALHTGAPIFPVFIFRERGPTHRVEVEGPLEEPPDGLQRPEAQRHILAQFARILESKIRKSPEQWLWAHRRWKSTPDRRVLILNDGKSGHLNQSLAVWEAFQKFRERQGYSPDCTRQEIIPVRFRNPFAKVLGRFFTFPSWGWRWVLERGCFDQLERSYADLVISCGSSLWGVNLWLKRENQAKSVVVLKPPAGIRLFDAVIAPRHDRLPERPNVFVTEGALLRHPQEFLQSQGEELLKKLGVSQGSPKRIGVLVGGDTPQVRFDPVLFEKILGELDRTSRELQVFLLATSSRRTPAWADEMLKRTLGQNPRCALLVLANEKNQDGIVPGILGSCDVILVSAESVSMVSEALSSGKPVVIFKPFRENALPAKLREFLWHLDVQKQVLLPGFENFREVLRGELLKGSSGALDFWNRQREVLERAVQRVSG